MKGTEHDTGNGAADAALGVVVLGDDHPYTLDSASHLVVVLHELGEQQAALDLGEDTLARMHRVLGADHPKTVAMADILATLRE